MAITIERAQKKDAKEILELMKIVGGETDNLTFGSEGIQMGIPEEEAFISSYENSRKDIFLTARKDDELVGIASFSSFPRARMAHRGEIAISIRQSAWGFGIGSMMMKELLSFAKNTAGAEIASLDVRSDNKRAIHLYEKFGFETIGHFKGYFKIDGKYIDFDLMEKLL